MLRAMRWSSAALHGNQVATNARPGMAGGLRISFSTTTQCCARASVRGPRSECMVAEFKGHALRAGKGSGKGKVASQNTQMLDAEAQSGRISLHRQEIDDFLSSITASVEPDPIHQIINETELDEKHDQMQELMALSSQVDLASLRCRVLRRSSERPDSAFRTSSRISVRRRRLKTLSLSCLSWFGHK